MSIKNPNTLIISVLGLKEVNRAGFEPATHSLEGCCSIQLSYQSGLFPGLLSYEKVTPVCL